MIVVEIDEFKKDLLNILKKVEKGEEIIIEFGKTKFAKIVPIKQREFGILKGQAKIPDDFDKEDNEINKMFYGE